MIFVHADMTDHIGAGRPNIIDDTVRALMQGASVPFAHLGNNRVTMRHLPWLIRLTEVNRRNNLLVD